MTHYFTDNRNLDENRKEHSFRFFGHDYIFVTDNGVFAKGGVDYGSMVLLESAVEEIHGDVLDLGCGYGAISVVAASYNPDGTTAGVDVNPRAVELTGLNAKRNGVSVEALVSDGFAAVDDRTFDLVLTNPPIRAGKKVIYRLFAESWAHLKENGILMAVIRRQQGAESAVKELNRLFGSCTVVRRDRGYWVLKCVKSGRNS
jgi:16S rRNA (guanine1207-N2)-methyltransferase